MANLKSAVLTNADASPPVINNANIAGGFVRQVRGAITTASADTTNDVHRFVRVPSNARISRVRLDTQAAFTTAGAADFGVYQTAANGGAVVDADLFGSAVSLSAAKREGLDITFESGEYTMAESVQPLWQVLGLTSDPNIEYDIAATVTTTYNGGQPYAVSVDYVIT